MDAMKDEQAYLDETDRTNDSLHAALTRRFPDAHLRGFATTSQAIRVGNEESSRSLAPVTRRVWIIDFLTRDLRYGRGVVMYDGQLAAWQLRFRKEEIPRVICDSALHGLPSSAVLGIAEKVVLADGEKEIVLGYRVEVQTRRMVYRSIDLDTLGRYSETLPRFDAPVRDEMFDYLYAHGFKPGTRRW